MERMKYPQSHIKDNQIHYLSIRTEPILDVPRGNISQLKNLPNDPNHLSFNYLHMKADRRRDFELEDLYNKLLTPAELKSPDKRLVIGRKYSESRDNDQPSRHFKKMLTLKIPKPIENETQWDFATRYIPKLKLPTSALLVKSNNIGHSSPCKKSFCTDRITTNYNHLLSQKNPKSDNKLDIPSPIGSRSETTKKQIKYIEYQQSSVDRSQESPTRMLKETVSTLSTLNIGLINTPIKQAKSLRKVQSISMDDLILLRQIGVGKSSKVFMVKDIKSGLLICLKCIKKQQVVKENMINQIIRQIKISSYCRHPNIVSFYGFFEDIDSFYLLSQLGCDGQLYKKLKRVKRFSEEATAFIIRQVLQAVAYLHLNKIVHRDIKPQNIVLCHGLVKLCDFGWSVHASPNQLRATVCGTPLYASPEILQGMKYDEKIDLWAIGMLAYELYFGNIPFDIKLQQDLIRIITDDVKFPREQDAPEEFKDFIQSILQKNPSDRLSCEELLKHPYILRYKGFETCQEVCLHELEMCSFTNT